MQRDRRDTSSKTLTGVKTQKSERGRKGRDTEIGRETGLVPQRGRE